MTADLDIERLNRAYSLVEAMTRSGEVPAAAVCVGQRGGLHEPTFFGYMSPDPGAPEVTPETLFLVASLTKPVTVAGVMRLMERGELTLDDPVARFVPEFGQNGKEGVTLRHVMTHTSGLPDMPPGNLALRATHAPLARFIDVVTRVTLDFAPGTEVRYQSMGTAMLGEVIARVAGVSLPEFLKAVLFDPLGMNETSLGLREGTRERVASIRLEPEQEGTDWGWNSLYWLTLGAPWGGLITSPLDYARFCRMMLNGGEIDGTRVLSRATVRAMTSNQLEGMPDIPRTDRRCRPWGLGWRLGWPGQSAHFGDLLGPRSFGHWGATGTLCWADPDADAFLVLLTTQPAGEQGRHLATLSNAFAAALL